MVAYIINKFWDRSLKIRETSCPTFLSKLISNLFSTILTLNPPANIYTPSVDPSSSATPEVKFSSESTRKNLPAILDEWDPKQTSFLTLLNFGIKLSNNKRQLLLPSFGLSLKVCSFIKWFSASSYNTIFVSFPMRILYIRTFKSFSKGVMEILPDSMLRRLNSFLSAYNSFLILNKFTFQIIAGKRMISLLLMDWVSLRHFVKIIHCFPSIRLQKSRILLSEQENTSFYLPLLYLWSDLWSHLWRISPPLTIKFLESIVRKVIRPINDPALL